jgi:thymidylate synthase (FAD)
MKDSHSVKLVWITPDAEKIVAMLARVSAPENQGNHETAPRLIGYLIRNKHWSPFEMASMCVEIETTRDIGRQLIRHRSMSVQEFSQRYSDVSKLDRAPLRDARMQDPKNRQNSIVSDDDSLRVWWLREQSAIRSRALDGYNQAIERGIAKEVARAVLPEGLTTSRLYMAGTIRSFLHFVEVRADHGTQREAQAIARQVKDILAEHCPAIMEAFEK